MQLSLIIPIFNAEPTLPALLDSINQQTLANNLYEVIMVDDGSTDRSSDIIKQYPHIQLLHQKNLGPGAARNNGMSHAKGEIMVFTDSDCILSDTFLDKHLNFHQDNDEVDGFCGSISANTHLKYGFIAFVDHLNNWFNYHNGLPERDIEYLPGANMSLKRRVIQSGLKWSEKRIAGEDVEFSMQLLSQGMRIKFRPDPQVRHIDRATFQQFLRHQYNWGFHAPFIRGRMPEAAYSFLFPNNIIKAFLFSPLIIIGYTALIIRGWLTYCPFHLLILALPVILIGKIWYAKGVLHGTFELADKKL